MDSYQTGGAASGGLRGVEIHGHAAALVVALLKAGELETAEAFVEWALEHLDYDLQEMIEDA